MWWRRARPAHVDAVDPVVSEAITLRAEFQRVGDAARAARPTVDRQRQEAAEMLSEALEAERRNHFAEAITRSMRRPE